MLAHQRGEMPVGHGVAAIGIVAGREVELPKTLPGLRRRVLVHRGSRPTRTEDGIDVWPVETFVQALEQGRLWPESAD